MPFDLFLCTKLQLPPRAQRPLWQGRFKSRLVDTDRYLLAVLRYVGLNPVRAAMVARPDEYRWSSVHSHLGRASDPLLTLHPLYLSLGRAPEERTDAYRAWLQFGVSEDDLVAIRNHIARERALGDARFQRMVERALNRPVACRPRGRPKKTHEGEG